MRVLITAGNTREAIDSVRDWGNIFSGNTGFAIAKAFSAIADVDLLTSNPAHVHLADEENVVLRRIRSLLFRDHASLRAELAGLMTQHTYDAIYMTAAVADYRPARTYEVVSRSRLAGEPGVEQWIVRDAQAGKVKSSFDEIAVRGERTEKLVDLFRSEWKHRGLLVKFKLEVGITREALIAIGQASRKSSGADYLVANTLDMVKGEAAGAYLLSDAGEEWVARDVLADRMVLLADKSQNSSSK